MNSRTELYRSKYASHHYDEQLGALFSDWFPETSEMDDDDFESEMKKWLEVSMQCKPSIVYTRCVNFDYPINPEQQTWMAQLLNRCWVNLGVKQYLHVVPAEYVTKLSACQMFQEFLDMKLENQFDIHHFSNESEAIQWLETSKTCSPKREPSLSCAQKAQAINNA
ncbi:MAG TPA: hypothetical protein DCS93_30525 [Microscillaceae bacterium]|nr:hypothetical protein [Microscillaceae bacterium]